MNEGWVGLVIVGRVGVDERENVGEWAAREREDHSLPLFYFG